MLLNCPSCSAKYKVADNAIPEAGRNVRCVACGHYWFQKPDNDDLVLESVALTSETTKRDDKRGRFGAKAAKPAHEKIRQANFNKQFIVKIGSIAAGWLLAIAVLGTGLGLAISNRNAIVEKWPKSASAFAFLGVPANIYGMEIAHVQVRSGVDEKGPRLVIGGVIRSIANVDKVVPYLRITLVDEKGHQKATWLADPGVTLLKAHKFQAFENIRRDIPEGKLRVIVTFSEPPKEVPKTRVAIDEHGRIAAHAAPVAAPEHPPTEHVPAEASHEAPVAPAHEAPPAAHAEEHAAPHAVVGR